MKKNIETKKKAATDLPELQAWQQPEGLKDWQKLENWQQPEAWPELKELQDWQKLEDWQTPEAQRNSNIENSKDEKESHSND